MTFNQETDQARPGAVVSEAGSQARSGTAATSASYLCQTELADGRQALLIDPGSWDNLAGTPWARRTNYFACRQEWT